MPHPYAAADRARQAMQGCLSPWRGSGREPGNVVVHQERVDDQGRRGAKESPGYDLPRSPPGKPLGYYKPLFTQLRLVIVPWSTLYRARVRNDLVLASISPRVARAIRQRASIRHYHDGLGRRCGRAADDHWTNSRAVAMIPVPSGVQVWLATGHTDMRKGFEWFGSAGAGDAQAQPAQWPPVRIPRPARWIDQGAVARWPGYVPVRQATGARAVCVAVDGSASGRG